MKSQGSVLDHYVDEIGKMIQEGVNRYSMARQFRQMGIETSETSIRRAEDRHKSLRQIRETTKTTTVTERVTTTKVEETEVTDYRAFEIEDLKAEVKDRGNLIRKLQAQDTLNGRMTRAFASWLEDERNRLSLPYLTTYAPAPKAVDSDRELLLCLSDAHYGEVVKQASREMYNKDIAQERLNAYRDMALRCVEERGPFCKMTVAVLGDMISGNIHDELVVTNQLTLTQQVAGMANMLMQFAIDLAAVVPQLDIVVVPGNHPRTTKKAANKDKADNFDTLIGQFMQQIVRYSNRENIDVVASEDPVYRRTICGMNVAMSHGDHGSAKVSRAANGMERWEVDLQAVQIATHEPMVELYLMGHYHQHQYLQGLGASRIVNGSIKGGDEYIKNQRGTYNEAQQVMLELDPILGIICQHHIPLGHVN